MWCWSGLLNNNEVISGLLRCYPNTGNYGFVRLLNSDHLGPHYTRVRLRGRQNEAATMTLWIGFGSVENFYAMLGYQYELTESTSEHSSLSIVRVQSLRS